MEYLALGVIGAIGGVLAFLTSKEGIALSISVATTVYGWFKHKERRADKVERVIGETFDIIEAMDHAGVFGPTSPTKGRDKWLRYVEELAAAFKAEGLGGVSGPEMAKAQNRAYREAWLRKPQHLNGVTP